MIYICILKLIFVARTVIRQESYNVYSKHLLFIKEKDTSNLCSEVIIFHYRCNINIEYSDFHFYSFVIRIIFSLKF